MELICLISKDEGTWSQISGLMSHGNWDKIILIGDEGENKFSHNKNFEFIKVDLNQRLVDLKENFQKKLKDKFDGMEVACSIASGNGKEHMALVSALINLPVGVRFVALTLKGIVYL